MSHIKVDEKSGGQNHAPIVQAIAKSVIRLCMSSQWMDSRIQLSIHAAQAQWVVVRSWRICRAWLVFRSHGPCSRCTLAVDSSRGMEYALLECESEKDELYQPNMGF